MVLKYFYFLGMPVVPELFFWSFLLEKHTEIFIDKII